MEKTGKIAFENEQIEENHVLMEKFKANQKAQKEEAKFHMMEQLAKSREFKSSA